MNNSKHTTTEQIAVSERAHQAKEMLEDRVRDIEHTYSETRHQLQKFNEQAVTFIKDNPGLCIVGAVATGYLVGRLASKRWLI